MDLSTLLRRGRRIRAVGIDDTPFRRGQSANVMVIGAVCADTRLEGIVSTYVRPDGFNGTRRVTQMLTSSKFLSQLHLVLLDGITVGGFNILDLPALHRAVQLPVVAVMRKPPNLEAVEHALTKLTHTARRQRVLARAGRVYHAQNVSFQAHGGEPAVIARVIDQLTDRGHMPEPLRLAHLIGGGVVRGQSGRRA